MTTPTHYSLHIRDLRLDMLIGVYDSEKQNPQPVVINIRATCDIPQNLNADNYQNVPCYKTIADDITAITRLGHIELVETLCQKIAEICLHDNRVQSVWVKVEKPNAIPHTNSVGVEMTFTK